MKGTALPLNGLAFGGCSAGAGGVAGLLVVGLQMLGRCIEAAVDATGAPKDGDHRDCALVLR